ncbi:hypothetical protein BLOT_003585 [Blomia tropicalis]|nr:hypothetical protein BLOT_003585 [Blomia tropicalis]
MASSNNPSSRMVMTSFSPYADESGNYLLLLPSSSTATRPPSTSIISETVEEDITQPIDKIQFTNSVNDMKHPMLKSFIAGSLSGTCSTLLFQPFDLVKTRIQNSQLAIESAGSGPSNVRPLSSTRIGSILIDVIKNEQLTGLWRGTVPSLLRCVPGVGLHFCCLDTLQNHFCSGRQPKAMEALAFGAASRTLAGVKTRMQLYPKQFPTLFTTVIFIVQKNGVQGLFAGLVPRMMRRTLVASMAWTVYEQMMKSIGIK